MLPARRSTLRITSTLAAGSAGVLALLLATTGFPAYAAEPGVGLGTAKGYAVLAGSTVTNTGSSVISGSVGLAPGTEAAVTGFPPGEVNNGTIQAGNDEARGAKADLVTAYNDAAGRSAVTEQISANLGGRTLTAGVYKAASAMALTGTLTLNGGPDDVFIFQAGSTLITGSSANVNLIGGASACNVFWQVGSSATLGTDTDFVGTIMALTSVTLNNRADVTGRVFARNAAVTLDDNRINVPSCGATPTGEESPTATPSATPSETPSDTPSETPSDSPSDTPSDTPTTIGGTGGAGGTGSGNPSGTGNGGTSGTSGIGTSGTGGFDTSGTGATSTIPSGHPDTGRAPAPAGDLD